MLCSRKAGYLMLDFEGAEAFFGNGIQEAYSVLDSVRAVLPLAALLEFPRMPT
jgi:hypothetical protein